MKSRPYVLPLAAETIAGGPCFDPRTVDVYGHLVPGSNRNAVNRLDDAPVQLKVVPAKAGYADKLLVITGLLV